MTNNEIKQVCIEQQSKRGDDYPKYTFGIVQTKHHVEIHWSYLDGECWTIDLKDFCVYNEHDEFMNNEMEDDTTLIATIQSAVYYMTSRY